MEGQPEYLEDQVDLIILEGRNENLKQDIQLDHPRGSI